jgi:hypothetical protein
LCSPTHRVANAATAWWVPRVFSLVSPRIPCEIRGTGRFAKLLQQPSLGELQRRPLRWVHHSVVTYSSQNPRRVLSPIRVRYSCVFTPLGSLSCWGGSSFRVLPQALATERSVVVVPSELGLPLESLAPLGCGVQTGAGAVMNTLKCGAGSSIAVFGVGSVGLSSVLAARAVGCGNVIAVDASPERYTDHTRIPVCCLLGGLDAVWSSGLKLRKNWEQRIPSCPNVTVTPRKSLPISLK